MFWILKSKSWSFAEMVIPVALETIFAYCLAAVQARSSDLAPVITTLPELKTSAVVFRLSGYLILRMHAANFLGLYCELAQLVLIFFRSSLLWKLAVATMLQSFGRSNWAERSEWLIVATAAFGRTTGWAFSRFDYTPWVRPSLLLALADCSEDFLVIILGTGETTDKS